MKLVALILASISILLCTGCGGTTCESAVQHICDMGCCEQISQELLVEDFCTSDLYNCGGNCTSLYDDFIDCLDSMQSCSDSSCHTKQTDTSECCRGE
jgi:hypothetical protein